MKKANGKDHAHKKPPGLMGLVKPYKKLIILLILLAILSNGLNLVIPKIISHGIDAIEKGQLTLRTIIIQFSLTGIFVFIFAWLQSLVQTYASELVARDLRTRLSERISRQSYAYIQETNPSRLLTNFTADIDSIKMFVSMAIVSIASSLFIIIGASILLFTIDWALALVVLMIIPMIGTAFYLILKKVRGLYMKGREAIDWLNRVITESILGAALIRVLNAQQPEYDKFMVASKDARNIGLSIMRLFSLLIPVIWFSASMATLSILALGGHFVITGTMSLGDLAAFNGYLSMLIFPIILIGFMSNVIAQAGASYQRIQSILSTPDPVEPGTLTDTLKGDIALENISLQYGQKFVLKDVSFSIKAGSRTAIIGPTAAGKTQLLYLLTNLVKPGSGRITYDGRDINEYKKETLHQQVGLVFQDSIIFNISLRENIAFNENVTEEAMDKAIETAALKNFVLSLPEQLNTIVSERGTSLSGGQKQRIMLARALAIQPKILLLDDFTARVDKNTEQHILENVARNYPGITLLSVTQKIADVEQYDQIILLMEGELVAKGTHPELMQTCPEYVQIYQSQRSTSHYELQPE
ncbi:ABC transporter ATP-binding protein [Chitinophaga niabensis]|uniref:ABC-type multidrug transport system, ATPase and permease component n=1 Tax=Chitinophaga niabensis TaxID=536979 RepID=A0A1N6K393_9BACT|nr:ABC transporter ATP-binding protein [Chitinophaga niabensis]SIO51011.1 ABC-type multidrug transport system, ATPase and permease component [Chitinophaga niabensis]